MNFGYRVSFQTLDKGNIEVFGPFGSSLKINTLSKGLSDLHSGFIFHYSFVMIVAMLCFFTCFIVFALNFSFNLVLVALAFSYTLFVIEQ
jgi:hypothetical protein